jgi:hypothetical protein
MAGLGGIGPPPKVLETFVLPLYDSPMGLAVLIDVITASVV